MLTNLLGIGRCWVLISLPRLSVWQADTQVQSQNTQIATASASAPARAKEGKELLKDTMD